MTPRILFLALACLLLPLTAASQSASPAATPAPSPTGSQQETAARDPRKKAGPRLLRIGPNLKVANLKDATPMKPREKFHLAYRTATNPFEFLFTGAIAGIGQARNSFPGYGQGAQGYAKRLGAGYADAASGTFWGDAVYPILLHEDPRYLRKGSGRGGNRFFYALSTAVICKRDSGTWGPNYANVFGQLTAGGLSNLYYPASDRGVALTFERAGIVTAGSALRAVMVEFWPDIRRKMHKK